MAILSYLAVAAALCISMTVAAPHDLAVSWYSDAMPVNLTVYYESLCPGCSFFIENQLVPTWDVAKDVGLMTVELRPFGNAQEKFVGGKWNFTCQHGVPECEGNMLETCIIHYYPDTTKQLEIIKCVDTDYVTTHGASWEKTLQTCSSTGVDVQQITACAKGDEGNELQHVMAQLTGPHDYTPWILIDGVESWDTASKDLLKAVCDAYTGTPPSVCN